MHACCCPRLTCLGRHLMPYSCRIVLTAECTVNIGESSVLELADSIKKLLDASCKKSVCHEGPVQVWVHYIRVCLLTLFEHAMAVLLRSTRLSSGLRSAQSCSSLVSGETAQREMLQSFYIMLCRSHDLNSSYWKLTVIWHIKAKVKSFSIIPKQNYGWL